MAGATRDDFWRLFSYVQDDLRQTQAKLVELRAMIAAGVLDRPPASELTCPECRSVIDGEQALAEHRYTQHDIGKLCLECGQAYVDLHTCPRAAV